MIVISTSCIKTKHEITWSDPRTFSSLWQGLPRNRKVPVLLNTGPASLWILWHHGYLESLSNRLRSESTTRTGTKFPPENLPSVPTPKAQQGSQSAVSKRAAAALTTLKVLHGPVNQPLEQKPSGFCSPFHKVKAFLKWAELLTHLSGLQEHPLCTWRRCSFWQFCSDSQVGVVHKWQFHCKWHHKQHIRWRKTGKEVF